MRIRITLLDVLVSEYRPAVWKLLECQINGTPPGTVVLQELERLRKKADGLAYNLEAETASQVEAEGSANP